VEQDGKGRDEERSGDVEAAAEIVEKGSALLVAGFHQAETGVAGGAAGLAPGAAGDLALGDGGSGLSFSEPLEWSGISGRSRSRSSSFLRA
jgi:hypothetical protein